MTHLFHGVNDQMFTIRKKQSDTKPRLEKLPLTFSNITVRFYMRGSRICFQEMGGGVHGIILFARKGIFQSLFFFFGNLTMRNYSSRIPNAELHGPLIESFNCHWVIFKSHLEFHTWAGWCKIEKNVIYRVWHNCNQSKYFEQYIRLTLVTSTVIDDLLTHNMITPNKKKWLSLGYPYLLPSRFLWVKIAVIYGWKWIRKTQIFKKNMFHLFIIECPLLLFV